MTADQTGKGTVQIALRISPGLRERIKSAAEANSRSVNSELTATLEDKYPPDLSAEKLKALVDSAANLLGSIEGVVASDKKASESVAVLRDHLEAVQAKSQSNTNSTERQQMFDETKLIFDRLADGLTRTLNIPPTEAPSSTKETRSTRDGKRKLKLPKKAGDDN